MFFQRPLFFVSPLTFILHGLLLGVMLQMAAGLPVAWSWAGGFAALQTALLLLLTHGGKENDTGANDIVACLLAGSFAGSLLAIMGGGFFLVQTWLVVVLGREGITEAQPVGIAMSLALLIGPILFWIVLLIDRRMHRLSWSRASRLGRALTHIDIPMVEPDMAKPETGERVPVAARRLFTENGLDVYVWRYREPLLFVSSNWTIRAALSDMSSGRIVEQIIMQGHRPDSLRPVGQAGMRQPLWQRLAAVLPAPQAI